MYKNYFQELKNRGILTFFSATFCFLICYCNKEILLFLSMKSSIKLLDFYFVTTNAIELLTIYIQLSKKISILVLFLMIYYNILLFLIPGLYIKEITFIENFSKKVFLLFSLFNLLSYYYIFPLFWNFFQSYLPEFSKLKVSIQFEPKLIEFFDLFYSTFYLANISSLTIIFLILFLKVKNKKIEQIKKLKKYFVIITFLIAAILTPPEIIYQLILAINVLFFLELFSFAIIFETIKLIRKNVKTNKNRSRKQKIS